LRSLAVALQSATVAQREADEQRSARGGAPASSSTWIGNSDSNGTDTNGGASSAKEQNFCDSAASTLETVGELLNWAVREAETLDPAARAEALKLPVEVAQQVVSRMIARGVRWVLSEQPPAEGEAV
jgi:hypothetical protein